MGKWINQILEVQRKSIQYIYPVHLRDAVRAKSPNAAAGHGQEYEGKTRRPNGDIGRSEVCSLARIAQVLHEVTVHLLRDNVLTYRTSNSI